MVFEDNDGEENGKPCVIFYVCLFRFTCLRESEGKRGRRKEVHIPSEVSGEVEGEESERTCVVSFA